MSALVKALIDVGSYWCHDFMEQFLCMALRNIDLTLLNLLWWTVELYNR